MIGLGRQFQRIFGLGEAGLAGSLVSVQDLILSEGAIGQGQRSAIVVCRVRTLVGRGKPRDVFFRQVYGRLLIAAV